MNLIDIEIEKNVFFNQGIWFNIRGKLQNPTLRNILIIVIVQKEFDRFWNQTF